MKRYKPSLFTVHNSYGNPYTEPYMDEYPTGKFLKYDDIIDFLKTIDDIDWEAVLAEGEGMEKICENCKHHKEQPYTGYVPRTPIQCVHPLRKVESTFTLRDSSCEKWEVEE